MKKLLKTKDKQFIESLYGEFYGLLFSVAIKIVKDARAAEDLVDEAFLKIVDKISLIRSLECYQTASYLVITVRRLCYSHLNKNKTKRKREADEEDCEFAFEVMPMPEDVFIAKEQAETLRTQLEKLSGRDRDLIMMKLVYEMSDAQIARLMGMGERSVHVAVYRAKQRAKKLLSEVMDDED